MCLRERGVGVGDQRARLAQAETALPEEPLALAHAELDLEAARNPLAQRLAVPKCSMETTVARRLAQNAVHLDKLRFGQPAGTTFARAFQQPCKTAGLKALNPVRDAARRVSQQAGGMGTTHSLGDQQNAMQTVIVARLLGAPDLVLQANNHRIGIGNA